MRYLVVLIGLVFCTNGWSQTTINIDYKQGAGKDVYIAYYLGDRQYIRDTFAISSKGTFTTTYDEKVDPGIHLVVFPHLSNQYNEFLWDGKDINITIEEKDGDTELIVSGNEVAEKMMHYLNMLQTFRDASDKIAEDDPKKEAKHDALQKKVNAYIAKQKEENKGNMFGSLLLATEDPEIPESLTDKTDRFYYYRSHYFDNVPFKEEWFLRSPIIHKKINTYLERLTIQHPDSIIQSVDYILSQFDQSNENESFQYAVVSILNEYASSKLMIAGNVYVHLIKNYYLTGKAFWVDQEQMTKLTERYNNMRYNVINGQAVNIEVIDADKNRVLALDQTSADYTILFFWEDGCGQCKKAASKLKEYYQTMPENVTILGFQTDFNKADQFNELLSAHEHPWQSFQFKDPSSMTYYDTGRTPLIYVLDRDKKIIAKRLSAEQTATFIQDRMNSTKED